MYLYIIIDAVVDEVLKAGDNAELKLRKVVALQSRYSDSEGEETREQCKTRMVCMFMLLCFILEVVYSVLILFGFILPCCFIAVTSL